ncbi:MAG: LemA family protein [Moraxella sp.]|nr:LemA family protein [Moraxella sp.]
MIALMIIVAILVLVMGYFIVVYNGLIRLKNQVNNALSQIDVQLKRRHELIPNLVESAKGYLSHEKETLSAVIEARNRAQALQNSGEHRADNREHMGLLAQAEGMLSKALGQFDAVVENYPELKADSLIQSVMEEMTNTENRISFARQHYNDSVMFYNNQREVFPNNIISGFFQFTPMAQLQFEDKSVIHVAPKVSFVD